MTSRSPKSLTVRIALGPTPDGVWRKRRTTAELWCSEMKAKIEERRTIPQVSLQISPQVSLPVISTKISMRIQDALIAIEKATRMASTIRINLRKCAVPRFEELFSPEEIAIEQKWVDSLVAFPSESV